MAGGVYSNTAELNGSGPFYVRMTSWDTTQDTVGNQTLFEWRIYIGVSSSGWATFGINGSWSTNMGGASGSFSGLGFSGSAWQEILVGSGNVWIGHAADGTRPGFETIANIDTDHTSVGDGSVTTWADAPTIPRATQPTLPASVDAGVAFNIGVARASTSFHHHIMYSFGSIVLGEIVDTQTASTYSWTPPLSLLNQIPNATSGTLTITVDTWTTSGGTFIGRKTATMSLTVPTSLVPNFTTVTATEMTSGVAANVGAFVQNVSKLGLAITGAVSSGYSATIASYKIEVAGQVINAASGTTPAAIALSGTVVITGTVTDSRGRTRVKTVNVTVLAYAPPVITSVSVIRSTSGGVAQDDGTYLKVFINAAVQSLINSTQRNALVYRVSTRVRNTPPWVVKATTTPGGITFNSSAVYGTYTPTTAYDMLVEIIDDFTTTAIQLTVPVSEIFMHWDGRDGVGFGKFREWGRGDFAGEVYHGAGSVMEPLGVVLPYAGATAPQGFLLCNGGAVSRTTYPALFTLIGTTYGAGDGTTTFNLPNLQGRAPVGRDSGQTEFDTLGESGGSKTHTITAAQLPAHSHAVNSLGYEGGTGYPTNRFLVGFGANRNTTNDVVTDNNTGGGGAIPLLSPYQVLNYIIRAL